MVRSHGLPVVRECVEHENGGMGTGYRNQLAAITVRSGTPVGKVTRIPTALSGKHARALLRPKTTRLGLDAWLK
jgi:hypothetical protein